MAVRFFNTLSRTLQDFEPIDSNTRKVGIYCCGPTVYDFGHIGNFRTFTFGDLVRRHLEFRGYSVDYVMNVTDVEDKIIQRVRDSGKSLADYTKIYTDAFLADLNTLGCRAPDHLPRATAYMDRMIELIGRLESRGIAYKASDGSVYFSIDKYRASERWPGCPCRYGQLVKLDFTEQRQTDRVSSDEYDKDHVADFALWKARVPADGEVFWESPWGQGRPGWHIECSAMSMALLGDSFDLHLGGEDLAFPHHEDEIAQSEGAGGLRGDLWTGRQGFVRYWLHAAHLLVEGKKMSKSLGNFYTLRDLIGKGFTGRDVRFLLLSAHYRETFNFTFDGLDAARKNVQRLDECFAKLRELAGSELKETTQPADEPLQAFAEAMDDDLNVSKAWGGVFEWVRDINRALDAREYSRAQAAAALAAWLKIDSVFGLGNRPEAEASPEIMALVEARGEAKKARDFAKADALRQQLKALGWLVEDTAKGPKLKRL
jgi:cysteinyl-tRNA synthetase